MKRVLIVGGGPVGLFLACRLSLEGVEALVLERRETLSRSSRSIGLHPPALEALAQVGLDIPLLECGVAIRRARVYDEKRYLGALSLERCAPPFPFVLSLPQGVTERLLEARLEQIAPGSLRRGVEVESVRASGSAEVVLGSGELVEGDFVVGCDGHRSKVRDTLAAGVHDGRSDNHYLMADLQDSSDLGEDAAIYLGHAGVVESFPLPGSGRRWVARLTERPGVPDFGLLRRAVAYRTGHLLPTDGEASSFWARSRLATPLAGETWALAGDSAHVVSPIGGQGMNLGLLGAEALVGAGLAARWRPERYDHAQRRRARRATRRASLNMILGGERVPAIARRAVLRSLVSPALSDRAARYFTMRGL